MAPTKTADHTPVYDADAHICEPPSIWTEYCDPKYRDRIIRSDIAPSGKRIGVAKLPQNGTLS